MRFVAILRNSLSALLVSVVAAAASETVYVHRDAGGVYRFSDVPAAGSLQTDAPERDRAERLWRAAERSRVERQCERVIRSWAMRQGLEPARAKPSPRPESRLDLLTSSVTEDLMKEPAARREIAEGLGARR